MGKRDGNLKRQSKGSGAASRNDIAKAPRNNATPQKRGIEEFVFQKISGSNNVTVDGLVTDIRAQLGYKSDRVVSKLIELKTEGKIRIIEKNPATSLARYAFSTNSLRFWGFVFAVVLSVLSVYITSGAALYFRYIFGSLLILFLPGYSLVEFLFARKQDMEDDLIRVALSIGLSLAIVPLIGLVLNYTPFGIKLCPIVSSLGGLTIILLVLGLAKKHRYYKMSLDM